MNGVEKWHRKREVACQKTMQQKKKRGIETKKATGEGGWLLSIVKTNRGEKTKVLLSFDLKDKPFMKKIKIALTSLTFALALTGVIVAKANEQKRFAFDTVYFEKTGGGFGILEGDASYFDVTPTNAAFINNDGGSPIQLYENQGLSVPVSFNP